MAIFLRVLRVLRVLRALRVRRSFSLLVERYRLLHAGWLDVSSAAPCRLGVPRSTLAV